jgi:hypothetical protein
MPSTIEMPKVDVLVEIQTHYDLCVPYLVYRRHEPSVVRTVLVLPEGVAFFDMNGYISHGTVEYLQKNFVKIRAYRTGERLIYTQG